MDSNPPREPIAMPAREGVVEEPIAGWAERPRIAPGGEMPPEPFVIPMREGRPEEPAAAPVREATWNSLSEESVEALHHALRFLRAESKRLAELLRAARTHEGRERNLAPLLVLVTGSAFALGLGLGWARRRYR